MLVVLAASIQFVRYGWLAGVFAIAYLLSVAVAVGISILWPGDRFRETSRDLGEALVICGVGLITTHLFFGPWSTQLSGLITEKFLGQDFRATMRNLPLWLALPLALFIFEGVGYLLHRLSHFSGPLWDRVHSVHHEPRAFGVALAMRFPYAEYFVYQMTRVVILQLTQIDSSVVVAAMVLSLYGSIFCHANTSLPFGFLNRFFNTPEVHLWHHDVDLRVNYSFGILVIFDKIAGTYYSPGFGPSQLGIDGVDERRSGLETMLLRPLRLVHHSERNQRLLP
jgi:sterol desaturase/sphingolipid hydroxylase (fatty acid hydroxylase superfamily)